MNKLVAILNFTKEMQISHLSAPLHNTKHLLSPLEVVIETCKLLLQRAIVLLSKFVARFRLLDAFDSRSMALGL